MNFILIIYISFLNQYDTDAQNKIAAYDRLMNENVDIKMELKSAKTEKDKMRLEVERVGYKDHVKCILYFCTVIANPLLTVVRPMVSYICIQ